METLFRLFRKLGCHQRPDRSFFIRGRQLPLCARCTGFVLGYAAALVLFSLSLVPPLWICAIAFGLPLFDWGAQTFFGRESTNSRRLFTGILGGWGLLTLSLVGVRWALTLILP